MFRKLAFMYGLLAILLVSLNGCGLFSSENNGIKPAGDNTQNSQAKFQEDSTKPSTAPMSTELQKAVTAMQAKEYDKALQITKNILTNNADDYQALSIQGMTLALKGDTKNGLEDVKKSYELNPNYIANYYNLALVYKLQGNLIESKKWFDQVLAKDPKNVWSIYGIATIYADQGNDNKALDSLAEAIKLDSSVKEVAREQDHFERFHGNKRFDELVK